VAGEPVDLLGPDAALVARGLVNYDAAELPGLLGRSTHDLARELGSAYEREVVHRDALVVLGPAGDRRGRARRSTGRPPR
jgi:glutamate 5-kinase